jgi:hypothetical protein
MVSTYFNTQIQVEALPPIDGGFDNRCWIPRSAFEGVPTQLAKLDQTLAEALAVGGLGPPVLNALNEPLAGWDLTNNVQVGEIDWALLFVRATNSDCKETGRVGIWLLAKTKNSDFAPDFPPGGDAETLTLYWMTPVTRTLRLIQVNPDVWSGPGAMPAGGPQSGLACFPVLRYHSDVRGICQTFGAGVICVVKPYGGDIGLDDCGCPEIPSGNLPPPFPAGTPSRFQNWGIYYRDQAYFDSNGMVPWGLPAAYLDYTTGGSPLAWRDWQGTMGESPPIPLGWMKPEACTFGASNMLANQAGVFPQIFTPPTGVFAWNCPDPPPGGGFLPILPP